MKSSTNFIPWARERFLVYRRTKADLFDGPDPPGHLQQLGSHRAPDPDFDIIDYTRGESIHPKDFWRKYLGGHRPCLLRGVDLNATAVKKWDVDYLVKNYGDVDLKIEPKKEARGDSSILNYMPKRLNIRDFMQRRKDNIYAVSVMPQNMAWEVNVPAAIMCGNRDTTLDKHTKETVAHSFPHPKGKSWLTHIYEANLWLADGRTRSQVHYDKESNMNCLYKGEKRWVLIDTRKHHHRMEWVRGGRYKSDDDLENAGTDWVPIDPDAVDLRVHKEFRDVTYYEFTQKAGDCVFLPYSMVHWVNKTSTGLQAAASWMWLPTETFNAKGCKEAPVHRNLPLAAYDILWYYSGRGVIPQGYPDPDWEVLRNIQRIMAQMETEYFTLPVLKAWLESGESPLKSNDGETRHIMSLFNARAKDPNKGLHLSEMRWPNVPLELWLKLATEGDPEGMLPCDIGEKYDPRPPEEMDKMDRVINEAMAEMPKAAAAAGYIGSKTDL